MQTTRLEEIEDDGVVVWSESRYDDWEDFVLYAKVDGKKITLERDMNAPAQNIRIDYPYIHWESDVYDSASSVAKSYNLEKGKVEITPTYEIDSNRLIKQAGEDRWQWLRPFEDSRVSKYAYPSYEVQYSQSRAVWKEDGGIYLDEAKSNQEGYKLLSTNLDADSLLVMDNQYIAWNQEAEGIWFYSLSDDASYLIETENFSPSEILIHNGKLAVLLRSEEESSIQLYDLNDAVKNGKPKGKSVRLNPELSNGIMAHLPLQNSVRQIGASEDYLVLHLNDGGLLY